MRGAPVTTGADGRPRIHIWPAERGASFSFGPNGGRVHQTSIGAAVETAIEAVERKPAVIIFEGVQNG